MFVFQELDGYTRKFMRQEFLIDRENGNLYCSRLLTEDGLAVFPQLLLEAISGGTIETLARKLENSTYWGTRARENSHVSLAEEQFNQYYMRGLLSKLLDEGKSEAVVYQANEQCRASRRGAQPGDIINCEDGLKNLRDGNRDQWRGTTGLVRCAKTGISLKRASKTRAS